MSLLRPKTLRWLLVGRLAAAQGLVLALLLGLNALVISTLWIGGDLGTGYSQTLATALSHAIDRSSSGRLIVRETSAMSDIRRTVPDLWFVAQDGRGQRISHGPVPADVRSLLPSLDTIDDASLGRRVGPEIIPEGIVRWIDTRAGRVHVIADVRGPTSLGTVIDVLTSTFGVVLFVIAIMALATLLVTPLVVRRALRGISQVAEQAARINIRRPGVRLALNDVPFEIAPLVDAINDALERLDQGYEQHKRFLSDTAHELRTPIAILTTRIFSLPKGSERSRLLEDTKRLEGLTGLLLDLQRLEQPTSVFTMVDLVTVVERVLLDLSPLAYAAGYEITFETETDTVLVDGDDGAIERAVTNLMQNAIDHGGRRGEISVWVTANGTISICDDGPGISKGDREAVFEPFRRLSPQGRGTGLGLDLVQRTMKKHGGYAEVFQGEKRGACFRLVFA